MSLRGRAAGPGRPRAGRGEAAECGRRLMPSRLPRQPAAKRLDRGEGGTGEAPSPPGPLIDVADLTVSIPTENGTIEAVRGISLAIEAGETVGIVGESGSGKTMLALSLLGLLPAAAQVTGSVLLGGEELLGSRFKLEGRIYAVVGVVKDVRHARLDGKAEPELYFPFSQLPITWRGMTVVARTESPPEQLAAVLRSAVQELDKDQPIYNVRTMEDLIAKSVSRPQFHLLLLGSFAALALVMASLGLYGVMSYTVTQRTPEIGIRMAFGAQPRDALRLVLGAGLALTLIGIVIGLLVAFALTRVMDSLLFSVSATDPLTFAAVAFLLIAVALLACFVPARRATKVDPLVAMRHE